MSKVTWEEVEAYAVAGRCPMCGNRLPPTRDQSDEVTRRRLLSPLERGTVRKWAFCARHASLVLVGYLASGVSVRLGRETAEYDDVDLLTAVTRYRTWHRYLGVS